MRRLSAAWPRIALLPVHNGISIHRWSDAWCELHVRASAHPLYSLLAGSVASYGRLPWKFCCNARCRQGCTMVSRTSEAVHPDLSPDFPAEAFSDRDRKPRFQLRRFSVISRLPLKVCWSAPVAHEPSIKCLPIHPRTCRSRLSSQVCRPNVGAVFSVLRDCRQCRPNE